MTAVIIDGTGTAIVHPCQCGLVHVTFVDEAGHPIVQHGFPPDEAIQLAEAIITAGRMMQQAQPQEARKCH